MSTIRKKPWNRTNVPVYSVASNSAELPNMNICTYATAVSMHPKRFIVAIYKGTKTLDNIEQSRHFVLQLLSVDHLSLVNRLSKFSGTKKDKLKTMQHLLADYNGFKILKDAVAVIEMKVLTLTDGGDHMLALCDMAGYKNISEAEVLTLDHLRAAKLVSI